MEIAEKKERIVHDITTEVKIITEPKATCIIRGSIKTIGISVYKKRKEKKKSVDGMDLKKYKRGEVQTCPCSSTAPWECVPS